ncbi:hypothetical protein DPMN_173090 [Dreissena polymorpha]|uniref:Uncharacterized protein n=1 Tax=Dreissena polymorpha TaxID=45954 RepID=A0A9D4E2S6_DREPO|nr:hypothetical protein DPMN_173090 [Dreissena polymorpha]
MEEKTNEYVRNRRLISACFQQEPLLATVRQRKLACCGHVTSYESMCRTVLLETRDVDDTVIYVSEETLQGGPLSSEKKDGRTM